MNDHDNTNKRTGDEAKKVETHHGNVNVTFWWLPHHKTATHPPLHVA